MYRYILILTIIASACRSSNSDERYHHDQKIGQGTWQHIQYTSKNGLIHKLPSSQTELHLRANAPSFQITFTTTTPSTNFNLVIHNLPQNFRLQSEPSLKSDLNGQAISPTKRRWHISMPNNTITLSPEPPKQKDTFDILAIGDIQNGISKFSDVSNTLNQHQDADFLLFLGDLTMRSTRQEFQKVATALDKVNLPIYASPGNHDVNQAEIYQEFFGRAAYSFVYQNTRFTSIDSASWGLGSQAWDQTLSWLEAGHDQQHIIFSHIPPNESFGFRGGQWKSRREAQAFIGHSIHHNIDAFFFGHLHTLDTYLLGNIPTYISGGAGAFPERLDSIGRHFLRIHIEPSLIQVSTIRVD